MARRAGSIDDDLASERRLGAKARRLPLHIHVALLFALLITGVGGAISWRNSIENRQLISSASHELIEAIGGKTVAAFASIDQPVMAHNGAPAPTESKNEGLRMYVELGCHWNVSPPGTLTARQLSGPSSTWA